MANLYSQYTSGTQFTAGTITGSSLGTSGINPIVDRLNSISSANSLIIGSVISGTNSLFTGSKFNNMVIPISGIVPQVIARGSLQSNGLDSVVIKISTTSGTNVNFISTNDSDLIEGKVFTSSSTALISNAYIVYSGAGGNFSTSRNGFTGSRSLINYNLSKIGNNNDSAIIQTTIAPGFNETLFFGQGLNVDIFNNNGSLILLLSGVAANSNYTYMFTGYRT